MKYLLILSILSYLNGSGQETDSTTVAQPIWIYVGKNGNQGSIYVKSTYQSKSDEGIKEWIKATRGSEKIKGILYKNVESKSLYVFDCEGQRLKVISKVIYNSTGKVISNVTLEDYEQSWIDVVPESVGDLLINKVCVIFKE